jgi:uncharacterized protein (TIGR02271 family)
MADDNVQHGIDDNPHGDPGKGAVLGGVGGAVVGALAGGPVGAIVGAVAGAVASGVGVAAVDSVDNDDTVSGIGASDRTGSDRTGSDRTGTDDYDRTAAPGTTASTHNTVGTGYADSDRTDVHAGSAPVGAVTPPVQGARSDMTNDQNNYQNTTNTTDADTMRVPVVEETININKDVHQAGEVAVSKHVVEEQVNVPVQVVREEVTVTRHAADRSLQPGEQVLGDDEVIRVPVMEETVHVNKQAHVAEEIEIRKHAVTEQQTVQDTVRREVVDIDDSTGRTTGGTV